jgi:hypothetical protein
MLSLLYPEIIPHLKALPAGLMPFRNLETGKLLLAIKASKEMILAAYVNNGFKFYVAPLPSPVGKIPALLTVFFDDYDEPLVIRTPMFNDELYQNMREMLSYDNLDIHFFDEHNREWMSYRSSLQDGGSCLTDGTELELLDFSHHALIAILRNAELWFSYRTKEDDARAITATFIEPLAPDNLVILDISDVGNDHLGGLGFSESKLIRENPGYYQERDIVSSLRRVFLGRQIAINPVRKDSRKELVDVLVLTDYHLLLIQAKDSPNTEDILKRTIERKRQVSLAQIAKGVKQAKGAVAYVKAHEPLQLLIGNQELQLYVGGRKMFSIIVIKEIFSDESDTYVIACRELLTADVDGVLVDYLALDAFAHRLGTGERFIKGLQTFQVTILEKGIYPEYLLFLLDYIAAEKAE